MQLWNHRNNNGLTTNWKHKQRNSISEMGQEQKITGRRRGRNKGKLNESRIFDLCPANKEKWMKLRVSEKEEKRHWI